MTTPYSFVRYTGDGGDGPYAVSFPYLDRAHVAATVDGAAVGLSWISAGSVTLASPAAPGALIEIRRTTPRDAPIVDFTDGSVLTEADLDRAQLQSLYLSQEAIDTVEAGVRLGPAQAYTANNFPISDVADPSAAQDAATKAYVDGTIGLANAAAATAKAAATNALNSQTLAAAYADAPADTPVAGAAPAVFSAKHWAVKASDAVLSGVVDASEAVRGKIALATAAEAVAGAEASKAVTPATLSAGVSARLDAALGPLAAKSVVGTADIADGAVSPSKRGDVVASAITWTVGASGATFSTLAAAITEAHRWRIAEAGRLTISIAAGAHDVSAPLVIDHPDGARLFLVGAPSSALTNAVMGAVGANLDADKTTNSDHFRSQIPTHLRLAAGARLTIRGALGGLDHLLVLGDAAAEAALTLENATVASATRFAIDKRTQTAGLCLDMRGGRLDCAGQIGLNGGAGGARLVGGALRVGGAMFIGASGGAGLDAVDATIETIASLVVLGPVDGAVFRGGVAEIGAAITLNVGGSAIAARGGAAVAIGANAVLYGAGVVLRAESGGRIDVAAGATVYTSAASASAIRAETAGRVRMISGSVLGANAVLADAHDLLDLGSASVTGVSSIPIGPAPQMTTTIPPVGAVLPMHNAGAAWTAGATGSGADLRLLDAHGATPTGTWANLYGIDVPHNWVGLFRRIQ